MCMRRYCQKFSRLKTSWKKNNNMRRNLLKVRMNKAIVFVFFDPYEIVHLHFIGQTINLYNYLAQLREKKLAEL